MPYLDKFAVLDDAQGEGLGRAVWQVMRDENPRLFWRSRHGNPVNAFYFAEVRRLLQGARSGRCSGTGWMASTRSRVASSIAARARRR